MLISYNEACAKECSSLEKDLVICEQAGFDFIEIRIDMLMQYLEHHTVEELQLFFASNRIRPHAFNAIYVYPEFLSDHDDVKRREELMQQIDLCCEVGAKLGSREIIVVPPLQPDPAGGPYIGAWEDTFTDCVRILTKMADYVGRYGMKLCFELVGFERSSVRSIEAAKQIVEAVNKENVGYVFDSYNIYLNGGCNDFSKLKSVPVEKIFAVHLMSGDDVPAAERGQDKRCFCGRGAVDTDGFLQVLKEMGYKGMISVETFRPEYWAQAPETVINNAYTTTRCALEKNGCL